MTTKFHSAVPVFGMKVAGILLGVVLLLCVVGGGYVVAQPTANAEGEDLAI